MVQTRYKLTNAELFLRFYSEQRIGSKRYYEETRELEKWQSKIWPEY